MITIEELTDGMSNIDQAELVRISDRLWAMGNLEEIKKKASSDLFYLHVSINITGNWQGEGWWFIICEQADLVPYIPAALDKLCLPDLKKAFENVIEIFPEFTVFKSDDNVYYDIANFLQNARFKVKDERLNSIAVEKRKEMVAQVRKNLAVLEELTKPVFGCNAECNGWKPVLDFISARIK